MRTLAVAALVAALSSGALAAPISTMTFSRDVDFNAASGGDRTIAMFRWGDDENTGPWEIALGDPTNAGARVQTNHDWSGGESFRLSYDGAGSLVLDFMHVTNLLVYPGRTGEPAIDTTGYNALALRANGRQGDVRIDNLQLNGTDFGPLVADNLFSWLVFTGLDVSAPWMLSGNIHFSDTATNLTAAPSLQVRLADIEPIPLPAAIWSMLAALAGLGVIGRRRRGAA
jgi:hypothetical protein